VFAAMAILAWGAEARLAALDAENSALEAELAPLRSLADVSSLEAQAAAIEERQRVIEGLGQGRVEGAALLFAVATSVRGGAWLTRLDWDGERIDLAGLGFDPAAAADLMDGLRATGCVDGIELVSVDAAPDGKARRFSVRALDRPTPCGVARGPLDDPFAPPHDPRASPDVNRPPLLRWPVELYRVVALVPGREATVQDPDGGRHTVPVGSMLGRPAGTVSFVTDTALILSRDEMVDASTDTVQSRLVELPLDPQ
jgi:hypothetical protein